MPVWRRKLTALVAVIALGMVALAAPRLTGGAGEQPRLRTLAIPQAVQAAKEPGKKVFTGVVGVLTAGGAAAPGWQETGRLAPAARAGVQARPVEANAARAPPVLG